MCYLYFVKLCLATGYIVHCSSLAPGITFMNPVPSCRPHGPFDLPLFKALVINFQDSALYPKLFPSWPEWMASSLHSPLSSSVTPFPGFTSPRNCKASAYSSHSSSSKLLSVQGQSTLVISHIKLPTLEAIETLRLVPKSQHPVDHSVPLPSSSNWKLYLRTHPLHLMKIQSFFLLQSLFIWYQPHSPTNFYDTH